MNTRTLTILLILIAVGAICAVLHWGIGLAQRRIANRFAPAADEVSDAPPSLRKLLIAWAGYALRTLVWFLFFAIAVKLIPPTRTGVESVGAQLGHIRTVLFSWLLEGGIDIIIIVVITSFLMRFSSAVIKTVFALFERRAFASDSLAARRRYQTLSAILRGTAQTVISFIGLMVLLDKLNVNITPILASAGVVGIAVGFGAQSLIKDIFSGFLILLEDHYSVGDTVKIGDVTGTVEHLTLRLTRIRGMDGSLTSIPNGSISIVSNLSKDWSRVVLDVEVSTAEDVDRAMDLVFDTAKQMKEEMPGDILEEPSMLGIDKLSSTGVTLRLIVKTSPTKHFEIGRELRRRIKLAFEREGIKAPMPQQQLVMTNPPAPPEAKAKM